MARSQDPRHPNRFFRGSRRYGDLSPHVYPGDTLENSRDHNRIWEKLDAIWARLWKPVAGEGFLRQYPDRVDYYDLILSYGPWAYWIGDSNNRPSVNGWKDETGNGRHGADNGGVTDFNEGPQSGDKSFSGVGWMPGSSIMDPNMSWTVAGWIKPDANSWTDSEGFFALGPNWYFDAGWKISGGWVLKYTGGKGLQFFGGTSTEAPPKYLSFSTVDNVLVQDEWQHVALVRNASAQTLAIYVNGSLVTARQWANNYNQSGVGDGFLWGGSDQTVPAGPQATSGKHSQTALWDRALNGSEVFNIYNAGIQGTIEVVPGGISLVTDLTPYINDLDPSKLSPGTEGDFLKTQGGAAQWVDEQSVPEHILDADPHTQYQKESEKNAASGYAGLTAGSVVLPEYLGTGVRNATKFLRDDGAWTNVPASGIRDPDPKSNGQFLKYTNIPAGQNFDDEILADSPHRYWKMIEAGSYVDFSGNGGPSLSGATAQGQAGPIAGEAHPSRNGGYALGSGDFIGNGVACQLAQATGWALELVVRKAGTPGNNYPAVFYVGNNASGAQTDGWGVHCVNNGNIAIYANGYIDTGVAYSNAAWDHLVIVHDGTVIKLYKNGSLAYTSGAITPSTPTTFTKGLGVGVGYQTFNGSIGHVALYASPLNSTRVTAHYNALIGSALGWIAADAPVTGIEASKNGSDVTAAPRGRVNFIEGSNVTLTVADDAGNNEIDVTIAAAGGGGGGGGTAVVGHSYLGKTTVGASYEGMTQHRIYAKKISLPAGSLITSIAAYVKSNAAGNVSNLRVGILSDNAGTPYRLIAASANPPLATYLEHAPSTTDPRWLAVPISYYSETAQDVWIVIQDDTVSANATRVAYDAGADKIWTTSGQWLTDAHSSWSITDSTRDYSIRASVVKAAGAGTAEYQGVRAYRTTTLSCTNGTWTSIPFDSGESWDTALYHDLVTNPSRFTVPVGKAGKYLISAAFSFIANGTGQRIGRLLVNGVTVPTGHTFSGINGISGLNSVQQNVVDVLNLNEGDYVEFQVYQSSGAALNLDYAYFGMSLISSAVGVDIGGWISADPEVWTYASADAPTFTFTIPGDKTAKYSPGMKIRLNQTTDKYFIITKVAYSAPNTTVTVYGGTDYTLANAAIASPYFSTAAAPAGFPLDPSKWTVELRVTALRQQATPTQNVWYNLGPDSIVIPIGVWDVTFESTGVADDNSASVSCYSTLSTANNSESDTDFTSYIRNYVANGTSVLACTTTNRRKTLNLSAKTTYYVNIKTDGATVDNIYFYSHVSPTIVRAVCAYLGGGGGAGDAYKANPGERPPAISNAKDDEFNDLTLDTGKWAWRNQGGATWTEDGDTGKLVVPTSSAVHAWRILEQVAPSTPWIISANLKMMVALKDSTYAGLCLVNNSNGKVMTFGLNGHASSYSFRVTRWTNVSTYSADAFSSALAPHLEYAQHLRIKNDGTTLTFYVSRDGLTWVDVYAEALATFIGTADRIGFGGNCFASGQPNIELGVHWFRVT